GLDIVGIEARLVGGECPYWGCIPTKMMTRAANALAEARRVPDLAGSATVHPDWAPVAARIRNEATDTGDDAVPVRRFEGKGGRGVGGGGGGGGGGPGGAGGAGGGAGGRSGVGAPPGRGARDGAPPRGPAAPRARRRRVLDEPRSGRGEGGAGVTRRARRRRR